MSPLEHPAGPGKFTLAMTDVAGDHRGTLLELFFDLVFVFGVTQVTATLGHDLSWRGLGRRC
jgi:low temperature requirement protein LtrA